MIETRAPARYSVDYYREGVSPRVIFHRTVTARDADEARDKAKIADPLFLATARSPRRGAEVR